jgi:DNA-binding GntR family transcriptional regulator
VDTGLDTGLHTTPHAATPRRDLAYQQLKQGLLRGMYAPGTRLGEERLAAELSMSRTPVREAFSRLHSEGLLERLPDGGFGPTLVDLPLVRELYEIRFALERTALRRTEDGRPTHDEAQVRSLRADWADLEPPDADDEVDTDFVLLDEDFHERLAGAAGNRSLTDELHKVNERIRIVRMQDFLTAERIDRTITQHLGVLDHVLADDFATAETLLIDHFDESQAVVDERAALAIARMFDRRHRA